MQASQTIAGCRSCGAERLEEVLDLGSTPLANRLLTAEELSAPEPTFPLRVVFCSQCGLVQTTETVDPAILYRDYVYFSSFSDAMLAHARKIADSLSTKLNLGSDSLVVEAASNDGYLLQYFVEKRVGVLGIEPARNIAAVARERGVATVDEFFSLELARRLAAEGKSADVFLGNNVLAHAADLNDFAAGVAAMLKPTGVAIFEVPYVRDMITHLEFDTIYHEHLCYYSAIALQRLFARHQLVLFDVERLPIHGGSIRVSFRHGDPLPTTQRARLLLEEERDWGMDQHAYYASFGEKVVQLRESVRDFVSRRKAEGARLAAYGAAAKGATLLNYCGIGSESIDFVVDRNVHKHGKFMPGVRLPIEPTSRLCERRPDYALLLTWNFADEILAQQADYRAQGGKFVIPVPAVRVV